MLLSKIIQPRPPQHTRLALTLLALAAISLDARADSRPAGTSGARAPKPQAVGTNARKSSPPRTPPSDTVTAPGIGRPAPDFMLADQDGLVVRLAGQRPRPVLLCFFCNCGLCQAFGREIARAADLRQKAEILVVASDEGVVPGDGFRRATGLTARYLRDAPPVVARRYRSEACPRCWLIDDRGIARYVNPERLMPAPELIRGMRAALAGADSTRKPRVARGRVPAPEPALRPTRVAPVPVGKGTIQADVPDFGLTLMPLQGPAVDLTGAGGRVPVSAGQYEVLDWWAETRDAEGRRWRVRGGFRPAALKIVPGSTAPLNLASPMKAQLATTGGPSELIFHLLFEGNGNEACNGVTRDGWEAPRPRIEVRDSLGRLVADLECPYCCGFKASARWKPPTDLHGTVTATPKVDFGPFKVTVTPLTLSLDAPMAAR